MNNIGYIPTEETWTGWAVVWVDHKNEVWPSHDESPGWYQEVYKTEKQAINREQELLDTVGGVWEVVQVCLSIRRKS